MYLVVSILIFIVCALLILIVLVQNSKGGGLSSTFASSNQIMGVRKTTDFLEKATWTLAGAMLVLCIVAAMVIPRGQQGGKQSAIQEQLNQSAPTQSVPDFGAPVSTTPVDDNSGDTQE
ncbi:MULTISPECIES: preprotein translocase subunit SecG [Butyricimonas]|uniref:Protein-export membrane protein SecG n=1 Tax=Butyricimonas hominis TaxID=2763032 RepID=A0ABR7D0T4_9BACT|nr:MULTISPECIES: preprotein translocase subunit SecG [Butyricimonas]MBC5621517.1 preprotein translocase subunit SecG [Butyricimonas hominis]MCB6972976.1 preprotein translocase subunit SecG [Butyricimonas synergistica]MCG4518512.1 preprotein translocase subunit SecG [Butyricimonas sp. DFI.6.44]